MALAAQGNEIHPQPIPRTLQPSFSCDIDYLKPFNGFTRDLRDRGEGAYQSYHPWAEGSVIFAPRVRDVNSIVN